MKKNLIIEDSVLLLGWIATGISHEKNMPIAL